MMKAIYGLNIAITAAVLLLLLASCTKETTPAGGEFASSEGERVISLLYSTGTKASLNDLTPPAFKSGDEILLSKSDGTKKEICPVRTTSSGQAYIKTHLTGTLKAVYPASAAVLSGNAITGVSIPSIQSGKLADAIIAMAENITGTTATLNSATAILRFYVDESIGVTSFTVTGKTGNISTGLASVSVTAASGTLYGTNAAPLDPRVCYVAVPAGINANTLRFSSVTTVQGQGNVTKDCTTDATLAAAYVYNAFIPYYIDLGAVGKWAYCNMGAFLPEEPGDFFMWGEIKGHKPNLPNPLPSGINIENAFSFSSVDFSDARYNSSTVDPSQGFCNGNAPYFSYSSTFSKYSQAGDELAAEDDAAVVGWGNPWRIPSEAEMTSLINVAGGTWTHSDDLVGISLSFNGKSLFFPSYGWGEALRLTNVTRYGYYWSSSIAGDKYPYSIHIGFYEGINKGSSSNRNRGIGSSIRPIYAQPKGVGFDPLDQIGTY